MIKLKASMKLNQMKTFLDHGSEHKQKLIQKKEALDKKVKDMKDYSTVVRKEKIPQISEA